MAVSVSGSDGQLWREGPDRGAPAAAGPAAGREAASPRLELKAYNRTPPAGRVIFLPCRCNCRTCHSCGGRYGYQVRGGLLTKQGMFRKPALLTLTLDRDNFEDPERAHQFVSDQGLIRRLMRYLSVELWVWVLEFQQKTGTGWPHWHILVDLWDLPGRRLDLGKAWRLWRDKWEMGGLDLQARKERFASPEHAIHYITKYLIKQPGFGYPAWVLETEKRIRFFGASGKLGGILSAGKAERPDPPAKDDDDEPTSKPRKRQGKRPFVERMAECGQGSQAFLETVDPQHGELRRRFLMAMDVRPGRLAYLARTGALRSAVDVYRHESSWDGGEQQELRPFIAAGGKAEALEQLEKLQDEISGMGEDRETWAHVSERADAIIENNMFARRAKAEGGDDVPF